MDIGGILAMHKSFQAANKSLQAAIVKYIQTNNLTNINFLITGHSRGAAVANILTVDLDNGNFKVNGKKNVYAYAFATPNYSKDLTADGYNYNNIFNFCFRDDFVTRVPLDEWGYGKLGITYWAVAEDLKNNKINFSNSVKGKVFNYQAVKNLLPAVYELAPTINDYYNKKLYMGPLDNPTEVPLYNFMRNYVAQAQIDSQNGKTWYNCTSIPGLGAKAKTSNGNDVHKIAKFFVDADNNCAEKYVGDTHDMWTYYYALKHNGFPTK